MLKYQQVGGVTVTECAIYHWFQSVNILLFHHIYVTYGFGFVVGCWWANAKVWGKSRSVQFIYTTWHIYHAWKSCFVYAAWHHTLHIKISVRCRQLFLVRSELRSCSLRKIMRNGLHILQTFPDTTFTKCHCYLTHSEIVTELTQIVSHLGQRQCIVTADFKLLKDTATHPCIDPWIRSPWPGLLSPI